MYGVASVAGATFAGPYLLRAAAPNEQKLRIAYVGTGGQAGAHIGLVQKPEMKTGKDGKDRLEPSPGITNGHVCPAYCDVDSGRWDRISALAPNAKQYTDYRKILEAHEKEIDCVVVTTPDHNHACASALALRMGKHVYTEKPLTWSVGEARALAELAAEEKVSTQMGNMGHANEGNRLVVEWVRGGVIGDVTEVHTWTNRPVWPQGIKKRPPTKPVPPKLDWDSWIGPAPFRDYHDGLHAFAWRGYLDFGCGAVGDMGCHTWDCVFWAMNPDWPSQVELLQVKDASTETYPKQCQIKWTFPAKGERNAFDAYWYEGGMRPPVPEEFSNDPDIQTDNGQPRKFPASGTLFIGTKGKLLVQGDYGDSPRLIPESFMKQANRPPKSLPRSPGHKQEWLLAAMGQRPWDSPGSHFSTYAGPLTEVMLLGAMAIRMGEVGSKIECDAEKRIIKTREVLPWANREYRKGWPQVSPKSAIS
jgi:predicted dehydrogenase